MNPARMRSLQLLAGSLLALALATVILTVWPGLDLATARLFALGDGRFAGDTPFWRGARHLFELLPFLLLTGLAALYALRRFGGVGVWAPNGAGLIVVAASLALGPGLLVNTVLKDHSHRPRPAQVTDFGGTQEFRPFYRFDGSCVRNCSFVSGEGSEAFWTLAPALLVPLPYRGIAIAGALVFGTMTAVLRMAFGGHFLSDTVFAALLTWLVILACWTVVARLAGNNPGSYRGRA